MVQEKYIIITNNQNKITSTIHFIYNFILCRCYVDTGSTCNVIILWTDDDLKSKYFVYENMNLQYCVCNHTSDPQENCYLNVKKLPKTWNFFKYFFHKLSLKKLPLALFFLKDNFWQFFWKKCQVFGNFLTVKWQFSGGSGGALRQFLYNWKTIIIIFFDKIKILKIFRVYEHLFLL